MLADLSIDQSGSIWGQHRLLPLIYHGKDISTLTQDLSDRLSHNPADPAALVDMAMLLQTQGQADRALAVLGEAIRLRRDYSVSHGDGSGLRILALVVKGDFMANTPVDFLLNGSNAVLLLHYVDETIAGLSDLPDHDVLFLAIGEASHHLPVLTRLASLLPHHDRPVMNADPLLITRLTRDGVSAMLADVPSLVAPSTGRLTRAEVAAVAAGTSDIAERLDGMAFPLIIRPIGTHAGFGMEKIHDGAELSAYLAAEAAQQFYITPFYDYRGADGLFGKQRIVFIRGRAYPSHMALSDHWMVHYLSGGMADDAGKRAVEADWMTRFDEDFAVRHADAFAALYQRIGLDYFGIDCGELPDGRLLVFEVDTAMVVHDMDDPAIFPYKQAPMARLFAAFVAAAEAIARRPH